MQIYSSLTRQCETLTIPTDRPITLYVCGVTPYDTTHVGHARTYLVFDVLIRAIQSHGGSVRYCQNVTDVDDPLFERARRDSVHWRELAQRETDKFHADCAALQMIPPTVTPKVSEEIDTMLPLIARLLEQGHAYERDGNIYFDVHSFEQFGAMAQADYATLLAIANERGNTPNDPRKKDPLDFVLWQTSKPDEPSWHSPWGAGRPGWHIECSAMATRYLGDQIDIHGGGSDLLFPHHSCEIAQTEPYTGKHPFARIWMHVGMVYFNGDKMSKSLGNLVFIRDALREQSAQAIRWYLLSTHYREQLHYDSNGVVACDVLVKQLHHALHITPPQTARTNNGSTDIDTDMQTMYHAFDAALANDLDTPTALRILERASARLLAVANTAHTTPFVAAQHTLTNMATVLGVIPHEYIIQKGQ